MGIGEDGEMLAQEEFYRVETTMNSIGKQYSFIIHIYEAYEAAGWVENVLVWESNIERQNGGVQGSRNEPTVNTQSDMYDLSNYGYRTVRTKGRGSLVFQTSPGGSFLKDYIFWDGDTICVNLNWRQNGYAIAYQNGTYGYVDASYINWEDGNSGGSRNSSDERYDLSNFEYRYVLTKGRGSLVF